MKFSSIEDMISFYEQNKEGYELLFGVDYIRLVTYPGYKEVDCFRDSRAAVPALDRLKEILGSCTQSARGE